MTKPPKIPRAVIEGIWDRVDSSDPDGCWPWLLSIGSHGYGQVGWQSGPNRTAKTTAHRVAWMAANHCTAIPAGMTVDHLCRNRRCCNPSHLRLLSHRENSRGNGQSVRTQCPQGHPYDEANTGYWNTPTGLGRRCRACDAARARRRRREIKEKSTGGGSK